MRRNPRRLRLGGTLAGTTERDFVLLVSHNPDYAEEITDPRVDLVLSGHTHGGQCSLFGLWAALVPSNYGNKYRGGWVQAPHTQVYVSNGIGTITPPVRFCAPPRILWLQLEGAPPRTLG